MSKVGKTKTISFSVENLDIYDLLQDKKNASQYICNAIRFYESSKDDKFNKNPLDDDFEALIEGKIKEFMNRDESKDINKEEIEDEEESITNINDISNTSMAAIRNFYMDQE